MAKPELGTKRLCGSCGAKFYDLSKDPIICPKCGTVFVVVAPVSRARPMQRPLQRGGRDRRGGGRGRARAKEAEAEVPETPDAEFVSLEDADAEAQGKKGDAARGRRRYRGRGDRRGALHRGDRKRATTTSPTSSAKAARTKEETSDPGVRGIRACSAETCMASGSAFDPLAPPTSRPIRGHSSAGRALAMASRGRRFDLRLAPPASASRQDCIAEARQRRRLPGPGRSGLDKAAFGRLSLFMGPDIGSLPTGRES